MCVYVCVRVSVCLCVSVPATHRSLYLCTYVFNVYTNLLQVYERGVGMFKWPHVHDIWNTYLTKFIDRYVSAFFTSMNGFEVAEFLHREVRS